MSIEILEHRACPTTADQGQNNHGDMSHTQHTSAFCSLSFHFDVYQRVHKVFHSNVCHSFHRRFHPQVRRLGGGLRQVLGNMLDTRHRHGPCCRHMTAGVTATARPGQTPAATLRGPGAARTCETHRAQPCPEHVLLAAPRGVQWRYGYHVVCLGVE